MRQLHNQASGTAASLLDKSSYVAQARGRSPGQISWEVIVVPFDRHGRGSEVFDKRDRVVADCASIPVAEA